jgi:hypothetical protein
MDPKKEPAEQKGKNARVERRPEMRSRARKAVASIGKTTKDSWTVRSSAVLYNRIQYIVSNQSRGEVILNKLSDAEGDGGCYLHWLHAPTLEVRDEIKRKILAAVERYEREADDR